MFAASGEVVLSLVALSTCVDSLSVATVPERASGSFVVSEALT